jgi:hypothetical protein
VPLADFDNMHQGLADFRYRRRDSDMDDLTYAQTYAKTMLTAYEKARLEGSKNLRQEEARGSLVSQAGLV